MSGNEAVSRAVWESGVKVAAAYPGTPATEMLGVIATYRISMPSGRSTKDLAGSAFGAAMAGSRAFCAMKHVGLNVASDALMTADPDRRRRRSGDCGRRRRGSVFIIRTGRIRASGRAAHVPILEPADSQKYEQTKLAFPDSPSDSRPWSSCA